MDMKDETSIFVSANETCPPDVYTKLKRKRAAKVIRYGAFKGDLKRPKMETANPKLEGSVTYQSLSSELYEWPSKVSVQDACNFQRSCLPSRFMFYDKGEWKDYSKEAVATLCISFRSRISVAEFSTDGKRYHVNFVQMLQLNLLTGFLRSVAWIDEHGKCFFPSKFVEGHGTRLLSQLQDTSDHLLRPTVTDCNCEARMRGALQHHDALIRVCLCPDLRKSPVSSEVEVTSEITSDNCNSVAQVGGAVLHHDTLIRTCPGLPKSTVSSAMEATSEITSDLRVGGEALRHIEAPAVRHSNSFTLLGDKVIKLVEGDQEFAAVRNRFLAGLSMLASHISITGIYRDTHTSTSGQARLQAFKKQEEITKKARGDAIVRYAWHGTSKQGVSGIVLHGFGQPRVPKNGAMYGVGVYLAPEDYSHVSAVYSDIDENGEQHMVLCQVIMGSMEQVCPGSEQFHPSSEEYDTGVDDICNPKRYIIWSTYMNTHVLPQYIVSFKLAPQWHAIMAALRGKQTSGKVSPMARGPRLDGQDTAERCTAAEVEDAVSVAPCKAEGEVSISDGSSRQCFGRPPRSPWMSFPMLFLIMRSMLPPANMIALQHHYLEFKAGRMSRDVLIRNLRIIAGDRVLADSIKSMQAQEKSNQTLTQMAACPNLGIPQLKDGVTEPFTKDNKFSSNEAV